MGRGVRPADGGVSPAGSGKSLPLRIKAGGAGSKWDGEFAPPMAGLVPPQAGNPSLNTLRISTGLIQPIS